MNLNVRLNFTSNCLHFAQNGCVRTEIQKDKQFPIESGQRVVTQSLWGKKNTLHVCDRAIEILYLLCGGRRPMGECRPLVKGFMSTIIGKNQQSLPVLM